MHIPKCRKNLTEILIASVLFTAGLYAKSSHIEQGRAKSEISFDPASGEVTVKMLVQDPNGYFIPNIRRDNFAVYENGVRQTNAMVGIEHSPVSLALLM